MLYIRYYVWVTYNYEQRHLYRNVHVPQPLVNDTHTHTTERCTTRVLQLFYLSQPPPPLHHSPKPTPTPPPASHLL
jgi:hypothetical protein